MRRVVAALAVLLAARTAQAENYSVVAQKLDSEHHGYTVLRVWGTPYEMGHAQGVALASDIVAAVQQVKASRSDYGSLRVAVASANWAPAHLSEELTGLVAGVRAVVTTDLDVTDLEVLNTVGDWGYACRSHACWGSYVTAPMRMLATRRLDFGTPFSMALHHVLLARQPADGSTRWVNLAWPGFVTVATAVSEHGVLVSLHDYDSTVTASPGVTSRSVAARVAVSAVPALALGAQLGWAQSQLATLRIATGTFINFYAPEGNAGVFTCASGALCLGAPRRPQPLFHGGQVMVTTNAQTTGLTMPVGGEFLASYYDDPSAKDMAGHYSIMGHDGLHLMTVGYRARGDMLLWAEGRQSTGVTPRIEVEWRDLFPPETAPDAGPPDGAPADGSVEDAPVPDAAGDGPAGDGPSPSGGGGCGCRVDGGANGQTGGAFLLLGLALLLARRGVWRWRVFTPRLRRSRGAL